MVERAIRLLLTEVAGPVSEPVRPDHCVLIDEPELHLHPNLQLKVLDYFRLLAANEHTQVILATHSPTMVESASFEELFILRPVELVAPDENQLVQVATDEERLRALRDLFGGTSNLTSLQPIVIVEGVREGETSLVGYRHRWTTPTPGPGASKTPRRWSRTQEIRWSPTQEIGWSSNEEILQVTAPHALWMPLKSRE